MKTTICQALDLQETFVKAMQNDKYQKDNELPLKQGLLTSFSKFALR